MSDKLMIQKVSNGYIVTKPVESHSVYLLSDACVFRNLYEVYEYLKSVMEPDDE